MLRERSQTQKATHCKLRIQSSEKDKAMGKEECSGFQGWWEGYIRNGGGAKLKGQ